MKTLINMNLKKNTNYLTSILFIMTIENEFYASYIMPCNVLYIKTFIVK